jgi:hypothetical protein
MPEFPGMGALRARRPGKGDAVFHNSCRTGPCRGYVRAGKYRVSKGRSRFFVGSFRACSIRRLPQGAFLGRTSALSICDLGPGKAARDRASAKGSRRWLSDRGARHSRSSARFGWLSRSFGHNARVDGADRKDLPSRIAQPKGSAHRRRPQVKPSVCGDLRVSRAPR